MTEILAVTDLTMRFGGLTAVNALSFLARQGEITSVIGPNGAGKTTVFNCITGFYRPTSGRIALTHPDGVAFELQTLPGHRIARRARVARTFQNIRLFAGMTVLENLLVAQHNLLMPNVASGLLSVFGLGGYARAETLAITQARAWLTRIGLLARADDPAGALPYGDQRRLEIARQLAEIHPGRWLLHPVDRARYGRGDAHFGPHRGAGPRQADRRRHARRYPRRPGRHRRLSR